jgi:hypothetical protein
MYKGHDDDRLLPREASGWLHSVHLSGQCNFEKGFFQVLQELQYTFEAWRIQCAVVVSVGSLLRTYYVLWLNI